MSREILSLYETLLEDLNHYLDIPDKHAKNKDLVLYIQLKLEIVRQSPLFRRVMKAQAQLANEEE